MRRLLKKKFSRPETSDNSQLSDLSDSDVVPSRPDSERLSREGDGIPDWREDSIPEWRSDNDVCCCGEVELVYGGNVQVELSEDGEGDTILHRKWYPCEVLPLRVDHRGVHHYGKDGTDRRAGQ